MTTKEANFEVKVETPVLENWYFVHSPDQDEYTPPELLRTMFQGNVYGHQRFPDGAFVLTSTVEAVSGEYVTTKNTTYKLGEPAPEYAKWCEENGYDVNYFKKVVPSNDE